jgi:hypothetical protein
MIRVEIDGRVLEGERAIDVVRAMREEASPWQQEGSLSQYIVGVADRLRIFGHAVHARGDCEEDRARALLDGMLACGFARRL